MAVDGHFQSVDEASVADISHAPVAQVDRAQDS